MQQTFMKQLDELKATVTRPTSLTTFKPRSNGWNDKQHEENCSILLDVPCALTYDLDPLRAQSVSLEVWFFFFDDPSRVGTKALKPLLQSF